MDITVTAEGLDALARKLDELPEKLNNKLMRRALQAGGDVVAAEITTRIPVATNAPTPGSNALPIGKLKASIENTVSVQPSTGKAQSKIGPTKDCGYVLRFIEYGYNLVKGKRKKGVSRTVIKHIPAHPICRPALEAKAQDAVNAMAASLDEDLGYLV